MRCSLKNFNRKKITEFDFASMIKVEFDHVSYTIRLLQSASFVRKLYHDSFSEKEIIWLIYSEIKKAHGIGQEKNRRSAIKR